MKQPEVPELLKLFLKKYKYFFVVILIGLLFLTIPSFERDKIGEQESSELKFSVESLQDEIEKMLARSEGVGRVELLLTLKSGVEQIYAEESRITRDRQESGEQLDYHEDSDKKTSVISGNSGGETPVLLKQIYPEFLGATVVCDGAENPAVRRLITEAIYALTGIGADKVAILKMKQ